MRRKIVILVALLLCSAAAVLAQDKMKANKNDQMLMDTEKAAWKNLVDKKYDDFAKVLADDYRSVYSFGNFDKTGEMEVVKKGNITSAEVSDQRVQWIDKNVALLTSMVKMEGIAPDGKTATLNLKTTSIVAKRGKDWVVVYHTDIR